MPKFLVVTVFPNKTRSAIPVAQIVSVFEGNEGAEVAIGDKAKPLICFCRESFDVVMEQLNHVD